jgi:hypothetical protein
MAHRVAPQATADLHDIWYYVAKESGSVEVANRANLRSLFTAKKS